MDRTTFYGYNVLGQAVSVSQPNPNSGPANVVTSCTYDTLGNQATLTDPNGNTTTSVYDGFGRLAETVQPDPNGNGGTNYPETFYVYDAGGQLVEKVAPAGPASAPNSVQQITAYQYDDLGRQAAVSQLDGTISSSTTTDAYGVTHLVYSGTTELTTSYGYDADGNQVAVTDPLLQVATYQYDHLNRLLKEIQPSPDGVKARPTTQYSYDPDGNKLTETDPDGNVTTFGYNSLNQLTSQSQTIALYLDGSTPVTTTATTGYQYDGNGNMVQETDADGQVTVLAYDALNRQTGQQWYANANDADQASDPSDVIVYTYDLDSELHSAADEFSSYTYTYNSLGQQTSVDNAGTPGVPEALLSSGYDAAGNRTSLSATIGGTADFANTYSFDALNRETQVTQGTSAIAGHDGVDSKLVNFTFNDLTGSASDRVASSAYGYDDFGRLLSLTHTAADGTSTYAAYTWTYDADSQVKSFTNSANIADYSAENVATYSYDHDGQLTGATPPSGQTGNASNSLGNVYDANGNATSLNGAGTTIGAGDTLLYDGTYYDTYDANGNLIEQQSATTEIINKWDNRNRLVSVTDKVLENDFWVKTEEIDYTYDVFNNLIGRQQTTYQSDGITPATSTTQRNVFDGTNMVLTFDGQGNLTDRYLWGPMVDQVLADEQFTPSGTNQLPSSAGNTLWSLGDNQNSVRDLVNDSGVLQEHIAYSPFGQQVVAQSTNPGSVVFVIGYTGTYTDVATADQLHGVRWYDPASQRWLSEDPMGFGAGDANLYRYCGNGATDFVDPTGTRMIDSSKTFEFGQWKVEQDSFDLTHFTATIDGEMAFSETHEISEQSMNRLGYQSYTVGSTVHVTVTIDWHEKNGRVSLGSGGINVSTEFDDPFAEWSFSVPYFGTVGRQNVVRTYYTQDIDFDSRAVTFEFKLTWLDRWTDEIPIRLGKIPVKIPGKMSGLLIDSTDVRVSGDLPPFMIKASCGVNGSDSSGERENDGSNDTGWFDENGDWHRAPLPPPSDDQTTCEG
jgi:RHS repeat-associated protein